MTRFAWVIIKAENFIFITLSEFFRMRPKQDFKISLSQARCLIELKTMKDEMKDLNVVGLKEMFTIKQYR